MNVMRRAYLGVDCGTQSTKVVLRDPGSGQVLAIGRATHDLIERDDGTREQDPSWWIESLRVAVRDAVRNERYEIAGIGVSGQQHGLVCLDERDLPVRAAKLWNDTTTARECLMLDARKVDDRSDLRPAADDAVADGERGIAPQLCQRDDDRRRVLGLDVDARAEAMTGDDKRRASGR